MGNDERFEDVFRSRAETSAFAFSMGITTSLIKIGCLVATKVAQVYWNEKYNNLFISFEDSDSRVINTFLPINTPQLRRTAAIVMRIEVKRKTSA